jgi:multiple sugar transport system ATP-binding protein
MASVRLVSVQKVYEGARRPSLSCDLDIPTGEFAVLVGPSGCGKSTTLRIVAGLESPTRGRVFIGEKDVTAARPAERDIAMVFQNYALYPHMTVAENLGFALTLRRFPKAEIKRRVEAAAENLELSGYLTRKPRELSGGQRQRVAIGRAVVREPKVFLFDEPLSNLDAKLRTEMRREIARIHRQAGCTSLYVTHDQTEAMTLADRIVVLKDGVVQQVGTPAEIYDRPQNRFVAEFFGSPTMNFIEREGQLYGIRPENLSLEARAGATAIAGQVDLREVHGAEAVLYVSSEAGELRVRAPVASPVKAGEKLTVWTELAFAHRFDPISGNRL